MSMIKTKESDKDKRLDHFLVEKFPAESRSFWQKKIKSGAVLVNGKAPSVHQFLKANDEIEIIKSKEYKAVKTKAPKYKILEETSDYLIIEKPAGMLVHPTSPEGLRGTGTDGSLSELVIKDYPEVKKVGEAGRWGVVHRLDRDVSGVMVFARTKKFYEYMKKQFEERKIKKIYLALVYGEVPKNEDELNFAIGRSEEGKMAARPEGEEGREAKTYFEVLERFKNYSYLKIRIFTGRTHQIRAHMLAYGHPVVGDKIYRFKKQKTKPVGERLFLHSHILGFEDLDGVPVEYKSPLPRLLQKTLEELR